MGGDPNAPSPGAPRDRLRGSPTSVKLVYLTLDYHGELSRAELMEESLLSRRAVMSALQHLDEQEFIDKRVCPVDARKRLYSLSSRGPYEP